MKKYLILTALCCFMAFGASAQKMQTIKLQQPDLTKGDPVMTALKNRQSTREFNTRPLSNSDLSALLWAACGINRPEKGLRTSPTARNIQEVDVYACMPEGIYHYDFKNHQLVPVVEGDFRPDLAKAQDYVKTAPVCLILVADVSKFKNAEHYAAIDVGIVSQNISLFCSGMGLVTVPRGFMDAEKLHKVLKLKDTQKAYLNHPVGYKK